MSNLRFHPKVYIAFVLLIIVFVVSFLYVSNKGTSRELYRTTDIQSISFKQESLKIEVKDSAIVQNIAKLFLKSRTKVRVDNPKLSGYSLWLWFNMKNGNQHRIVIGHVEKKGNVLQVNNQFYKGDSLLKLIHQYFPQIPDDFNK